MTTCASCSASEVSATRGAPIRFKGNLPVCALDETAQTGKRCRVALSKVRKNLVNDEAQTIRALGLAQTRLPGHSFCNFRLLHPDSTVTGEAARIRARVPFKGLKLLKQNWLLNSEKDKTIVNET
jgi:hypothetical protein